MIYLWRRPSSMSDKFFAMYDQELSPDRFLFSNGVRLTSGQIEKEMIFNLKVTRAQINKYDNIPNNSIAPLVNQKIIDLLLQLAPHDVQFFDVEVRCKDGLLSGYKLLNVTSNFVGIDHEKSIYSLVHSTNAIPGFKHLTYKPGCMGKHKLARDAEYLENLLVSEEIKQAFEKEKIKGIWFATPEEWYVKARGG